MSVERHFTATAFVVHENHIALHWHPKVKAWLPPGGHIDANEDPVQAVLRETEEETGLKTAVVSTGLSLDLPYPVHVQPPLTILIEDIDDPDRGYHQHIDMIYVTQPIGIPGKLKDGWFWIGKETLSARTEICASIGNKQVPPDDVRILSQHAFEIVAQT